MMTESINRCLEELRVRNIEAQKNAAVKLRNLVRDQSRQNTEAIFLSFMNDLSGRVFHLVNSSDNHEKLGGILAIDELISIPVKDNETKIIRFANYLRVVFPHPVADTITLQFAARTLGHLAKAGGSMTADFVEFEVKRALEWLQNKRYEHRRHAAVLLLKELAEHAPTLFYQHVSLFFRCIWVALSDDHVEIRDSAGKALASCLALVAERRSHFRYQWYDGIYKKARSTLVNRNSSDSIHGALLTIGELLHHTGSFMDSKFNDVCDAVLKYKDSRDKLVKRTVVALLPRLAQYQPSAFVRSYADTALTHLLSSLKSTSDRPIAFLAVGRMAGALGQELSAKRFRPKLEQILDIIKDALAPKKSKGFCQEALMCVSMLARAVGPAIVEHLHEMIDPMFSHGLDRVLIDSLSDVAAHIPALLPLLQERLLHEVSLILANVPFTVFSKSTSSPPAELWEKGIARRTVPTPLMSFSSGGGAGNGAAATGNLGEPATPTSASITILIGEEDPSTIKRICLALKTLRVFDLRGVILLPFVRDCVSLYLDSQHSDVRREAALTCSRILTRSPLLAQPFPIPMVADAAATVAAAPALLPSAGPTMILISQLLERLLMMGVADPDPHIRATVLASLKWKLDVFLARACHLRTLFMALNDENFQVRQVAITLIGRLTPRNPAYVMPALRKTMVQLLTELEYLADARQRQEAAELMGNVITAAQQLVMPYVPPILNALLPKLREGDPGLSTCVLACLGELSRVGADSMVPYLDELVPLIIVKLEDASSSSKQEVAARTLGLLLANSGYVVIPLVRYPPLMGVFLRILSRGSTAPWKLRREVLRTMGVLGALDPYRLKMVLSRYSDQANTIGLLDSKETPGFAPGAGEGKGPANKVANISLANFFAQDPALSPEKFLKKGAPSGDIIERVLELDAVNDDLASGLMDETTSSGSNNASAHLAGKTEDMYLNVVISSLLQLLHDSSLSMQVVNSLTYLFRAIGRACVPYLPQVLPQFLNMMRSQTVESTLRDNLLQHIELLVPSVKHSLRPYLPDIFDLISTVWPASMAAMLKLVQAIARTLPDDFKTYLPDFLPLMLSALDFRIRSREERDQTASGRVGPTAAAGVTAPTGAGAGAGAGAAVEPAVAAAGGRRVVPAIDVLEVNVKNVLAAVVTLAPLLSDHHHLLVPALTALVQRADFSASTRTHAVDAISRLAVVSGLVEYDARILHPLARVLKEQGLQYPDLAQSILDCFCLLLKASGPDFLVFVPLIDSAMAAANAHHPLYSRLVRMLLTDQLLPAEPVEVDYSWAGVGVAGGEDDADMAGADGGVAPTDGNFNRVPVNYDNLRRSWEVSQRSTRDDWIDWMRRFALGLLRESPSQAFRSCVTIAQTYAPLAMELFNAAFLSVWRDLPASARDQLVSSLEGAFSSPTIPPETLQTLLNLAEFMEHAEDPLPISSTTLGALAAKCHAYAKALHYKEKEFNRSPAACVEALISINNQLEQPEAAVGILTYAQDQRAKHLRALEVGVADSEAGFSKVIEVKERWYEKLGRWEEALDAYERKAREELTYGTLPTPGPLTSRTSQLSQNDLKMSASTPDSGNVETPNRAQHFIYGVGSLETTLGRMRCLKSLGEWGQLSSLCQAAWTRVEGNQPKRLIAPLAARAAWALGDWQEMQRYVSWTDPGSVEGAFFRAVFAVHQENFESAQAAIDRARRLLAADLTALVGESYDRAYRKIVTVQQLSEMEEVVTYMRLRAHGSAEAAHSYISNVRKMWDARLRGCQRSVSVWHRILSVRSLIVVASEDADSWIKFASLCRSTGRLNMSHKVLHGLGMDGSGGLRSHYVEPSGTGNRYPEAVGFLRYGSEPGSYGGVVEGFSRQVAGGLKRVHARVFYAHTKHLWDSGNSEDALQRLTALVGGLETTIGNSARGISETLTDHASELFRVLPSIQCSVEGMNSEMLNNLRVKAYLRQGQWHLALADRDGLLTAGQGKLTEYAKSISPALNSFKKATNIGPENYNAWHTWAVLNYTAATEYDKYTGSSGEEAGRPRVLRSSPVPTSDDDEGELASEDVNKHVTIHSVAAIRGFFRSISLGRRRLRAEVLQDLLRLLTLWFTHGGTPEVHSTLEEQLDSIPIHTWLHVIPQLVARIHISVRPIQRLLHQLLARVGDTHPQALIYPLTVASKSSFAPRREAALTLMRSLRQRHKSLVDQADMVSQELIRVAILWEELWHSTLEEASRLYFGDKNIPAMLNALLPLHELMARGATTMRELAFQQAFGEQLTKAFNWLKRYQETQHVADLNVAWDHYYSVYTRINNQLPSITHLNLQFVSPSLTSSHNLELAVPGTYTAGYFASSFSGYGAKEGQRGDIFPVVCIAGFEEDVQVLSSKQRPRKITIRGSNGRRYLFLLKGHEDLRQDERVMQLFGLVNALLGNDPDTRKRDLSIRYVHALAFIAVASIHCLCCCYLQALHGYSLVTRCWCGGMASKLGYTAYTHH